jgi:hypothetical protein
MMTSNTSSEACVGVFSFNGTQSNNMMVFRKYSILFDGDELFELGIRNLVINIFTSSVKETNEVVKGKSCACA